MDFAEISSKAMLAFSFSEWDHLIRHEDNILSIEGLNWNWWNLPLPPFPHPSLHGVNLSPKRPIFSNAGIYCTFWHINVPSLLPQKWKNQKRKKNIEEPNINWKPKCGSLIGWRDKVKYTKFWAMKTFEVLSTFTCLTLYFCILRLLVFKLRQTDWEYDTVTVCLSQPENEQAQHFNAMFIIDTVPNIYIQLCQRWGPVKTTS